MKYMDIRMRIGAVSRFFSLLLAALVSVYFAPVSHAQVRKNVLMITDIGPSHPGPGMVGNEVIAALHADARFQVEFYWENMDSIYHPENWQKQIVNLVGQYRDLKLDLIVLVGPTAYRVLAEPKTIFPNVPVVFCCAIPGMVDPIRDDHRSTGAWFQLEPSKTVEAAMSLMPETRHLYVVAGHSDYDRGVTAVAKADLDAHDHKLDVTYLTDLPMSTLLERLRNLPDHSIVLFLSFFKDVEGREFLNAPEALPMIAKAANAPVFGVASTYLGRGIVGGFVVSPEEGGKILGRDAVDILGGKPAQDIPVVNGPNLYLFDWRELRRWRLDESGLPAGSTVLFRQPTLWEKYRQTLLMGLLALASLSLLTIYLLFERKQLEASRLDQLRLSGMLINAHEMERARLAYELHDDFSQRLAMLSWGLEAATETARESPGEVDGQLRQLINSASELGDDLHTLSHRLHSATLEQLGLAMGVSVFCAEFTAQRGIQVVFSEHGVPRCVPPEISLCLFRIVQEGLRNIQKHSGAANAQVMIETTGDTLHLSISDDGAGYDVSSDGAREGLGLRSMRERARLVGGRFEIHSKIQQGTRIDVWVPLTE